MLQVVDLTRHVEGEHKYRIGGNYTMHEYKYDFTRLNFPISIHGVKILEKKNTDVTVDMYGLQNFFQPPPKY